MKKLLLDLEDYEKETGRHWEDGSWFQNMLKRKKKRCAYCGKRNPFTKDHVIPKSKGGSDDPSNLVMCCISCNSKKNARTPEEAGMPIKYRKESTVKL